VIDIKETTQHKVHHIVRVVAKTVKPGVATCFDCRKFAERNLTVRDLGLLFTPACLNRISIYKYLEDYECELKSNSIYTFVLVNLVLGEVSNGSSF
jgi:hypothetical protein